MFTRRKFLEWLGYSSVVTIGQFDDSPDVIIQEGAADFKHPPRIRGGDILGTFDGKPLRTARYVESADGGTVRFLDGPLAAE